MRVSRIFRVAMMCTFFFVFAQGYSAQGGNGAALPKTSMNKLHHEHEGHRGMPVKAQTQKHSFQKK